MKTNNKKLRGVTLTEVIIVLAVIAIISTIVISFIVVSNENVRISSQKVDALNDITVVESLIDGWFSTEMDNLSSEYFEENEERKRIDIVSNRDDINYLKFDGIKIYSKINGDESYYQPESITNIEIIFENGTLNVLLLRAFSM